MNKRERSSSLPNEFKNSLGTLPDVFRNPPGVLPDQFSKPNPLPLTRNKN